MRGIKARNEVWSVLCVRKVPGAGIGGPKRTVFEGQKRSFCTFFFRSTTGSPFEVPVAKQLCKRVLATVLCIFGSGEGFAHFSVFWVFFGFWSFLVSLGFLSFVCFPFLPSFLSFLSFGPSFLAGSKKVSKTEPFFVIFVALAFDFGLVTMDWNSG